MTPSGFRRTAFRLVLAASAVVGLLNTGGLANGRDDQTATRAVPQGRRLALLVANAAYPAEPLTDAALDDAQMMAQALRDVRFDVTLVENASRAVFDHEVDRFVASIKAGDVVLFYYAGHGIQIEGENYLLPVDFAATDPLDARYQAVALNRLNDRLASTPLSLSVTILDACLAGVTGATRFADGTGWVAVNAGSNGAVMLGAAPGTTAGDLAQGGTRWLVAGWVETLREPGLALDEVFARVQTRVSTRSNGQQVPWFRTTVGQHFVFRPAA